VTTAIADYTAEAKYIVPDCPTTLLQWAFKWAVNQFMRETRLFRRGFNFSFTTTDVVETYNTDYVSIDTSDIGSDLQVMAPISTLIEGNQYSFEFKEPFGTLDDDNQDRMYKAFNKFYYLPSTDLQNIVIWPFRTEDIGTGNTWYGYMEVAVAHTLTTTAFDEDLWNNWREEIVSGALYRVFAVPRRPWSDANMAAFHREIFQKGISRGKSLATTHTTNDEPRVEQEWFC